MFPLENFDRSQTSTNTSKNFYIENNNYAFVFMVSETELHKDISTHIYIVCPLSFSRETTLGELTLMAIVLQVHFIN